MHHSSSWVSFKGGGGGGGGGGHLHQLSTAFPYTKACETLDTLTA